jgi:hypothetical protein
MLTLIPYESGVISQDGGCKVDSITCCYFTRIVDSKNHVPAIEKLFLATRVIATASLTPLKPCLQDRIGSGRAVLQNCI